nr:PREDICTED: uncharacterized protein LOC109043983 [Bemisia tabaci]
MNSYQTRILLKAGLPYGSSKLAWRLRKYLWRNCGNIHACLYSFVRKFSEKSMEDFVRGKQATMSLQWESKNFSPNERKRQYNLAVDNLRIALDNDKDGPPSKSDIRIEPIISEALRSQDLSPVNDELKLCLESNKYPSFSILQALASLSVESKNSQCVGTIRNVVEAGYPVKYLEHAKLLLHAAEVSWRINNFSDFQIFLLTLFQDFPQVKAQGKLLLSQKIAEAVQLQIEPALLILRDIAQKFIDDQKDYFPMTVLWYYLFFSNRPSNLEMVEELLKKNKILIVSLSYLMHSIALRLLESNRVHHVLKLLEFLLKHELHEQYSAVQQLLFKYHYLHRNAQACCEIYKSSVHNKLPLSEAQRDLYLKMISDLDDNSFKKLPILKPIEIKF